MRREYPDAEQTLGSSSGKRAALVSILASAYFATAAIMAHLLTPDHDFITDYISVYAIGRLGWIYGSAFLASCMGCLALAFALVRLVPAEALSRAGVILLVIVGLAYAVDFAFPTDILPPGASSKNRCGICPSGCSPGWLGAIRVMRFHAVLPSAACPMLAALASLADGFGVAGIAASRRDRRYRRFKSSLWRSGREGLHPGSQHLGADHGDAGIQPTRHTASMTCIQQD